MAEWNITIENTLEKRKIKFKKKIKMKIFNFLPNLIQKTSVLSDHEDMSFFGNFFEKRNKLYFHLTPNYLQLIFVLDILRLSLLYMWKYFKNQNKNYVFKIRKDCSFCD